ncbi:MAG: EscU/YscU/HrcU family type III secretion system export apparatus switch protein [Sandaracinaceae bacterium]|nr:EscU/YscU/HrcU family type III secretion system export apparatus switch protein [Sandaracinaceae bacterium]
MAGERTEEATPKKLRDARKKGQVAKSRELATAGILLAALAVAVGASEQAVGAFRSVFGICISAIENETSPIVALEASLHLAWTSLAPVLATLMLAAALTMFVQVGPLFTPQALAPSFERLDVLKGMQQLFSRKQAMELVKSIFKIGLIGVVVFLVLKASSRGIASLAGSNAAATVHAIEIVFHALFLRVGVAMLAIAAIDVLYQRWQFARDQRMTKEEVKREYKESEGDPHTKSERERVRREIFAHSVFEQVRRADVLVVNPTHLAVALRYDEEGGDDAPEVLAKGQDDLARRMIEVAREASVPIMRDVPLARALYEMESGELIPEALYEAVAIVLQAAWAERDDEQAR